MSMKGSYKNGTSQARGSMVSMWMGAERDDQVWGLWCVFYDLLVLKMVTPVSDDLTEAHGAELWKDNL